MKGIETRPHLWDYRKLVARFYVGGVIAEDITAPLLVCSV